MCKCEEKFSLEDFEVYSMKILDTVMWLISSYLFTSRYTVKIVLN